MGETELKKALRREGEERAREHWREAEIVIETRRQEIDAQRSAMLEEAERTLQADVEAMRRNLLFSAEAASKQSRLLAETALAERLFKIAQLVLPKLAETRRDDLWHASCVELPEADWATLTIHPDDRAMAEQSFPDAEIISDETIGGGLIAACAEGTVRIDNSLSCRLARAWPDLLPELMDVLRREVEEP